MRSVDRIGMGIGQTRGLSLHLRAFRPNWHKSPDGTGRRNVMGLGHQPAW
ncbi:hypothetical protein HMPREF9140_00241 [Prevotella micans F0438]|uniref:Uncharacterized protein n=1 Tax=Prevotella micans F0438 TaxID=883158 RepID=H1Q003_9BACT|nr:hypothetical protein HMPREF9140_00241 [Prevotella micans F0438]